MILFSGFWLPRAGNLPLPIVALLYWAARAYASNTLLPPPLPGKMTFQPSAQTGIRAGAPTPSAGLVRNPCCAGVNMLSSGAMYRQMPL